MASRRGFVEIQVLMDFPHRAPYGRQNWFVEFFWEADWEGEGVTSSIAVQHAVPSVVDRIVETYNDKTVVVDVPANLGQVLARRLANTIYSDSQLEAQIIQRIADTIHPSSPEFREATAAKNE